LFDISVESSKRDEGLMTKTIKQALDMLKDKHIELLKDHSKLFEHLPKEKQFCILGQENKRIRRELIILNKYLSIIMSQNTIVHKPNILPLHQRIKYLIKNNLKYYKTKYIKYQSRVTQLTNPHYLSNLKATVKQMANTISELKKSLKEAPIKRSEDKEQDMVSLVNELLVVKNTIKDIDTKMEKNVNSLKVQAERVMKVRKSIAGMELVVPAKNETLEVLYNEKLKEKMHLKKCISLIKTRYIITLKDYMREYMHKQIQLNKTTQFLKEKEL